MPIVEAEHPDQRFVAVARGLRTIVAELTSPDSATTTQNPTRSDASPATSRTAWQPIARSAARQAPRRSNKAPEYLQQPYDVFLSYAREDRTTARTVAQRIEAAGWTVFWDQRIVPGRQWERVIEKALSSAKCIVVLWSRASVDSEWVRAEAGDGADRDILVPAMIEDVALPLRFKSRQCADLRSWTSEPSAIDELLDAVRWTICRQGDMR